MKYQKMQRSQEGARAGIFGLSCNLILAATKLLIGLISNCMILIADGANNLTDGVSALLTILGFRIEAIEEDELHPYGHGRIEYVIGFLISLMILSTGVSIGKEAIKRIFYPEVISESILTSLVLLFSILIKLGMMFYYQTKNKSIKSPALEAVRKDSVSDACASALTMIGLLIMPHSGLPLDGIFGTIMAVYIFISGAKSFRENLALLLGEGSSQGTEKELREILTRCLEIDSVEKITFHDYGPDKKVAVAEINLVKDCDKERLRIIIDHVVQLCRDTMNIELSLYGSLY